MQKETVEITTEFITMDKLLKFPVLQIPEARHF